MEFSPCVKHSLVFPYRPHPGVNLQLARQHPRPHSSPPCELRSVTASPASGPCSLADSGCAACWSAGACGCASMDLAPEGRAHPGPCPSLRRGVSVRAAWPACVSLGTCLVCPALRTAPYLQPWSPSGLHTRSPPALSAGSAAPRWSEGSR